VTDIYEFDLLIGPSNRHSGYAKPCTVRGTSYGDAARKAADVMGYRRGDWTSWEKAMRQIPHDTQKLLDRIAELEAKEAAQELQIAELDIKLGEMVREREEGRPRIASMERGLAALWNHPQASDVPERLMQYEPDHMAAYDAGLEDVRTAVETAMKEN
jgi:uncharacterized coiled-coil protein SlyX